MLGISGSSNISSQGWPRVDRPSSTKDSNIIGLSVTRLVALFGEQVREANGDEPFKLKVKGVIPDATRNVLSDLIALHGVPATRAIGALKCIAQAMGRRVEGNVSERSLGRITLEGGAALMGQFVEAVHEAEGGE